MPKLSGVRRGCVIEQLNLELSTNWEVGDVAICITPGSEMEGKEVIVLTSAFEVPDWPDLVHEVDPGFPPGDDWSGWGAERRHLRSLPDPNRPGTWDECIFKPKQLVT